MHYLRGNEEYKYLERLIHLHVWDDIYDISLVNAEGNGKKETAVVKTAAKEEKKQERLSLKERLVQKKDIVAKNEANREPRQMNKDRGAQALA